MVSIHDAKGCVYVLMALHDPGPVAAAPWGLHASCCIEPTVADDEGFSILASAGVWVQHGVLIPSCLFQSKPRWHDNAGFIKAQFGSTWTVRLRSRFSGGAFSALNSIIGSHLRPT